MSNAESTPHFSKWRSMLWPIHNYELKKFLPMAFMFFCILFNYTSVRNMKDALVTTAAGSGAETLQFLKTYCVTPAAIIFLLFYTKGANLLSREKLFYATMAPFIVFFAAFALFLYPYRDILHPSYETIKGLQESYPAFKWFFSIGGNWTFALFYIMAEMWGSVTIALLFWQFANEITRTKEAKRFYGLFGLIANVSGIFAGTATKYFSKLEAAPGVDPNQVTINWMMTFCVISGILTLIIYRWMNVNVLTNPIFYNPEEDGKVKKKKPKLSIGESFKFILTSPYLGLIALLVLSYGVSINLIEGYWKSQVKLQYPTMREYGAFMGDYSTYTSYLTILVMLIGSNILRIFSWQIGALITPLIFVITGVPFFGFVLFQKDLIPTLASIGTTPLVMAVLFGAVSTMVSKAIKYSLFDPTKEMAYIPLDNEFKVKGKAVVDVLGGRFGKSGGSFIQSTLLMIMGGTGAGFAAILTPVAATFVIILILWIMSVNKLNGRYTKLIEEQNTQTSNTA